MPVPSGSSSPENAHWPTRSELQMKLGSDVEIFVHGAMCMAISGRCLLPSVAKRKGELDIMLLTLYPCDESKVDESRS